MAKVQGKKAATSARKGSAKPAKKGPKPAARAARKPQPKKPAKSHTKNKKAASKPAPKPMKKASAPPKKAVPAKAAATQRTARAPKPAERAAGKVKSVAKTVTKVAATAVGAAGAAAAAARAARAVAPAPGEGKKRRRSRPRITSSGPATATWFQQGEKRPSSFIPAPPRAEAPSLVAAPPASSDRLVSSHELTEFAVRTVPVRVDVEAGGGRIFLSILPLEVVLRIGEGIEWDFRYIGGADVVIDEIIIEFDKPSPFSGSVFRSRRPGAARPHRQLSGPAQKPAAGKRVQYTIRAMNAFKTEMAKARPWVEVIA